MRWCLVVLFAGATRGVCACVCVDVKLSDVELYCARRPGSVHTGLFVFAFTGAGCVEETPRVCGWGDSNMSVSMFTIARSLSRSQQHGSQSRLPRRAMICEVRLPACWKMFLGDFVLFQTGSSL